MRKKKSRSGGEMEEYLRRKNSRIKGGRVGMEEYLGEEKKKSENMEEYLKLILR